MLFKIKRQLSKLVGNENRKFQTFVFDSFLRQDHEDSANNEDMQFIMALLPITR